jgi:hypothetical protein
MSICGICCETLNQSNHKECICQKCNFSACKTCVRTYLGSTPNESHCMNCKFEWSDTFVLSAVNKTYFHKDLRDQKKQKCFEIEKSKLADSQIEAKQFLIKEKSTNDIKDIDKKIKELRQQIEVLKQTKYEIAQSMRKKIVKEQKAFIMRCQAANCNGFVSKSYKCELCDKTTCSKCFIILTEDHECKADDIETASYIKQNSKPCPKCATRISRIDGCSQMWCTNCQTPFDWTSGLQLTNVVVHNPHYFQYLQQANAGIMPRNPNDVLCGGMPDLARFRSFSSIVLHDKDLQKCITTNVYNIYRFVGHIQQSIRTNIIGQFDRDVESTRIKLIIGRITEEQFKEQIYKHYSIKNKRVVNNRLLETVHVVAVDLLQTYFKIYEPGQHMSSQDSYEHSYKLIQEFTGIIDYFNDLQEQKTQLFKEKGIRININNYGLGDINKNVIMPFNNKTHFPLLQYNLVGYAL